MNGSGRAAGRAVPIVLAAALLLPGAAMADQLAVQVGRAGEVVAQEAGPPEPAHPGNMAGTSPVHDPTFLRLGTAVNGTPCRQFGFEFRATNLPHGVTVPVVVQLSHPTWTRPDGQTGTVETNVSNVSADRWTYAGYTLEESWSLVPGPWTFTVSQGPRVLATIPFTVTTERGQTVPSDGCSAQTS